MFASLQSLSELAGQATSALTSLTQKVYDEDATNKSR
jgi:hypothetical protein